MISRSYSSLPACKKDFIVVYVPNFTACKSFAKTEEYKQAISELEKTVYVLEHITDKYSFDLVNIF